jgi:NADH:ubiquinone oxidoreductase subunit E
LTALARRTIVAKLKSGIGPPDTGRGFAGKAFQRIQGIIDDTGGQVGAPIRVLQQAQSVFGYLPPTVLKTISRDLKIPQSELHGVVTFYSFFSMLPKGRHVIQVCLGTACYVRGGQSILDMLRREFGLEPEGITPDARFSLEIVRCLGCCGLAPVIAIGDDIHRKVKPSQVKDILSRYP